MKLRQLQEARYLTTSKHYTDWVKRQIASRVQFSEYPLEDLNDVREAVDDLTNGLGKPNEIDDEDASNMAWGWDIRLDDCKYAVWVNSHPELFVEQYGSEHSFE